MTEDQNIKTNYTPTRQMPDEDEATQVRQENERRENRERRQREIAEKYRITREREEENAKAAMDRGAKEMKDKKIYDRLKAEQDEKDREEQKRKAKVELAADREREMREKMPTRFQRVKTKVVSKIKHPFRAAKEAAKHPIRTAKEVANSQPVQRFFWDNVDQNNPKSTKRQYAQRKKEHTASGELTFMDSFWAKPPAKGTNARKAPSGLLDLRDLAPSPSNFLWGMQPKRTPARRKRRKRRTSSEPEPFDPFRLLF